MSVTFKRSLKITVLIKRYDEYVKLLNFLIASDSCEYEQIVIKCKKDETESKVVPERNIDYKSFLTSCLNIFKDFDEIEIRLKNVRGDLEKLNIFLEYLITNV